MTRHYVLTLNGAAQQLSSALGGDEDRQLSAVWLSPRGSNANLIFIGGSATLTSTNYGVRLEIPVSSVPQAPFNPGEFAGGSLERFRSPIKMGNFWVLGTNGEFLHILAVDY